LIESDRPTVVAKIGVVAVGRDDEFDDNVDAVLRLSRRVAALFRTTAGSPLRDSAYRVKRPFLMSS